MHSWAMPAPIRFSLQSELIPCPLVTVPGCTAKKSLGKHLQQLDRNTTHACLLIITACRYSTAGSVLGSIIGASVKLLQTPVWA